MRNRKTLRISEVDFDSAVESLKEAMTELNDHYLVPKDSPKTPNAKKAQALISEALDLLRAVKFFEVAKRLGACPPQQNPTPNPRLAILEKTTTQTYFGWIITIFRGGLQIFLRFTEIFTESKKW